MPTARESEVPMTTPDHAALMTFPADLLWTAAMRYLVDHPELVERIGQQLVAIALAALTKYLDAQTRA